MKADRNRLVDGNDLGSKRENENVLIDSVREEKEKMVISAPNDLKHKANTRAPVQDMSCWGV